MSALDIQVAGSHYKNKAIQPIEYIAANGLNFCEGSIVKYITRWRDKGGLKDLEKIKHYVDLLIEMEAKYGKEVVKGNAGSDQGIGNESQRLPESSAKDAPTDSRYPVRGAGASGGGWGSQRSVFQGTPEAGSRGPDFP